MTLPLARSGEPPEQGKHESGTVPAPRHQGPRPRGFWRRHARQVASAIQEIAAFHCILSESVIERIGMLSADELARWLRDMLGVLRRRVGAHVQHQPFYPGFPEQVLKASKAELYLTAVMHYLTLRRLPAHEHARPPLLEGARALAHRTGPRR